MEMIPGVFVTSNFSDSLEIQKELDPSTKFRKDICRATSHSWDEDFYCARCGSVRDVADFLRKELNNTFTGTKRSPLLLPVVVQNVNYLLTRAITLELIDSFCNVKGLINSPNSQYSIKADVKYPHDFTIFHLCITV